MITNVEYYPECNLNNPETSPFYVTYAVF